jgi:hypothetical protein
MTELGAEVEQRLADMSDSDFAALVARTRAPDAAEQLKDAASAHLSGDRLAAFLMAADPSKFVGDAGEVDKVKVDRFMRTVFGSTQHGDVRNGTAASRNGQRGKSDAQRRHGRPASDTESKQQFTGRGAGGRAAAARRHPTTQENT